MWTEEKLKEAALECWLDGKYTTLGEAFLAGCKYIINNTQKEKWKQGSQRN